jgi:hypothetical protein
MIEPNTSRHDHETVASPKEPVLPIIGRRYRSKDGELATVIGIARQRHFGQKCSLISDDTLYVILRRRPWTRVWNGTHVKGVDAAIPAVEWVSYKFQEITLDEYVGREGGDL